MSFSRIFLVQTQTYGGSAPEEYHTFSKSEQLNKPVKAKKGWVVVWKRLLSHGHLSTDVTEDLQLKWVRSEELEDHVDILPHSKKQHKKNKHHFSPHSSFGLEL